MTFLNNKELASIRSDVNNLLPDTGYIITVTNTPDGFGGYTTGTAMATNGTVTCRLDPEVKTVLKSGEALAGGMIEPFHRFVLTLPYNTAITTDNQFLLGTTLYNVMSVDSDKSWKASVRAFVERV